MAAAEFRFVLGWVVLCGWKANDYNGKTRVYIKGTRQKDMMVEASN